MNGENFDPHEEFHDIEELKKNHFYVLDRYADRLTVAQKKALRHLINNEAFEKFGEKLDEFLTIRKSEPVYSFESREGLESYHLDSSSNFQEIKYLQSLIKTADKRSNELSSAYKALLKAKSSLEKTLSESNSKNEQFLLKIKALEISNEELTSKIQQERIDDKIPGYVDNVKSELSSDDLHFIEMSKTWAKWGGGFGVLAVAASFASLFVEIDFTQTKGFELFYLFTRGLIGISILSWLSYVCLSNSKKYTHESIRRKDRRHALMFGQVFLQIYGSTATKEDAIEVFKDWNMSGGSAFSDQTEQPLGIASLVQAAKDKLKVSSPDKSTD